VIKHHPTLTGVTHAHRYASGNVVIIRAARPHFGECAGDLVCGKLIVEDGGNRRGRNLTIFLTSAIAPAQSIKQLRPLAKNHEPA
jgi:hypothetical protein